MHNNNNRKNKNIITQKKQGFLFWGSLVAWNCIIAAAFAPSLELHLRPTSPDTFRLFLRRDLQIPILDTLDSYAEFEGSSEEEEDKRATIFLTPLPSAHLPPEISTPFIYGMQVDRPIHKLLLEEAAANAQIGTVPMYGHLVWKDKARDSLIGAIGCTAEILLNAPTTEVLSPAIAETLKGLDGADSTTPPSESSTSTILCRGGFRFVVKEIIKSIPYPVVVVDEIEDDDEIGDSDMFATVSVVEEKIDSTFSKYSPLTGAELIQKTMRGIQSVVSQNVEEAQSKQTSPVEKEILQTSGVNVDPNAIEQARAFEMAAVWDVFQESLVDDVSPQDRKYAVAIMAVELADMNNEIRRKVLLTRDAEERLRIVLAELDEVVGMTNARKVASQITGKIANEEKDLKVGTPQLPPWAKTIAKGTRVEYFWNEEWGWCPGEVIEDPKQIVDEILLTVRFDEDGEVHVLPLTAADKVRWRPPERK